MLFNRISSLLAVAITIPTLSSAHFQLKWPLVRGYDEEQLTQYPCGGQNRVSDSRTEIPINSPFPIQVGRLPQGP